MREGMFGIAPDANGAPVFIHLHEHGAGIGTIVGTDSLNRFHHVTGYFIQFSGFLILRRLFSSSPQAHLADDTALSPVWVFCGPSHTRSAAAARQSSQYSRQPHPEDARDRPCPTSPL